MPVDPRTLAVHAHVESFFGATASLTLPDQSKFQSWCDDLRIVELDRGSSFVYATAGACTAKTPARRSHEFVIQSPTPDTLTREALFLAAYWHVSTDSGAHIGNVLRIGAPWYTGSPMTKLLVSLPYPYGPKFELVKVSRSQQASFVWLLPVHDAEATAIDEHGLEAFEEEMERQKIRFDDPQRPSAFSPMT
jgi:hypothetical protein